MQVEPSLELLLESLSFRYANPPTTTAPPVVTTLPPPPEPDRTWLYILLLLSVVFLGMLLGLARICYLRQLRRREEIELWEETHPGMVFPRRTPYWQRLFMQLFPQSLF